MVGRFTDLFVDFKEDTVLATKGKVNATDEVVAVLIKVVLGVLKVAAASEVGVMMVVVGQIGNLSVIFSSDSWLLVSSAFVCFGRLSSEASTLLGVEEVSLSFLRFFLVLGGSSSSLLEVAKQFSHSFYI